MLVIEQALIADLETFNVSAIKGRKDLNVSIYPVSLNYIYTSEAAPPSLYVCGWILTIEKLIKIQFFQIETFINIKQLRWHCRWGKGMVGMEGSLSY